ncbi:transaldolase family protein [Microbacterium sp. NIBRBAC000506063]|uniref:transaldolase family protein n=1 Tax=Microbacterium sp. NIBRBAC000506063 TaxID=2734618 RepID=UPI001BB61FAE|nr:transaldolase family protein [Microbacterium sp. NIBRBAC000506063]QTV80129.1 hypothetical protein KAE78_03390 [Microbacterium sp. NIBRBAC000506063]
MLYLDSADRTQLEPLLRTGVFAGVTTNPLILQRAGLAAADLPSLHTWLGERGAGTFFAQATGASADELRASSRAIAGLGDDVVVKLPATSAGLTVARELVDSGCRVLVTAVYHPTQILTAAAVGAQWIAPTSDEQPKAAATG